MGNTPQSLAKLKAEHIEVEKQANKMLYGELKEQARYELKQAQAAPLYYVTSKAQESILANLKTYAENPPLLSNTGFLVFEEGTSLLQPLTPYLPHLEDSVPRFEIQGLHWYLTPDDSLMLCPVFQSSALRAVDPKLMPRKAYTGLFPFMAQRRLMASQGTTDELLHVLDLLKSVCISKTTKEEKKMRYKQGRDTVGIKYTELSEYVAPELGTLSSIDPTSPTSIPVFSQLL